MNVSAQSQSTALATTNGALDTQQQALVDYQQFRRDLDALRDVIAPGVDDTNLILFGKVCQRTGLDPFTKQIYAIMRKGRMTIQTGIDGLRLIAERSGRYQGQTEPEWCGEDGVWRKVWLDTKKPPSAARVGIYKEGFREPIFHVARWASYAQLDRDGKPTDMWRRMPDNQLLKCAEAGALRKGFPAETQGLYTDDEMGQADNPEPASKGKERPAPTPEQQAKQQQVKRLMAIAKQKWPTLDDKLRPEYLKKFCAKRDLLAPDADGQASIRASSTEQVKAAADALEAWDPKAAAAQQPKQKQGEKPAVVASTSEPVEGELVEDEDEPVNGNLIEQYEAQLSGIADPGAREEWFRAELARARVEAGNIFGNPDDLASWNQAQLKAWLDWLFARLEQPTDGGDLGW